MAEKMEVELSLLEPEEREMLEYIWNLIPEQDRVGMTRSDVLFVLDSMDDYLKANGLMEVDESTGEVTYLEGDVDEVAQLEYIHRAVSDAQSAEQPICNSLSMVQLQLILDAEVQYGVEQGYYEEDV